MLNFATGTCAASGVSLCFNTVLLFVLMDDSSTPALLDRLAALSTMTFNRTVMRQIRTAAMEMTPPHTKAMAPSMAKRRWNSLTAKFRTYSCAKRRTVRGYSILVRSVLQSQNQYVTASLYHVSFVSNFAFAL